MSRIALVLSLLTGLSSWAVADGTVEQHTARLTRVSGLLAATARYCERADVRLLDAMKLQTESVRDLIAAKGLTDTSAIHAYDKLNRMFHDPRLAVFLQRIESSASRPSIDALLKTTQQMPSSLFVMIAVASLRDAIIELRDDADTRDVLRAKCADLVEYIDARLPAMAAGIRDAVAQTNALEVQEMVLKSYSDFPKDGKGIVIQTLNEFLAGAIGR